MYKQVLIEDIQKDLQRFVFRFSPNSPLKDYRLKTVTFGTANAPYIAIRVLKALAELVRNTFPRAATEIMSSMYMDDTMGGTHSLDELIKTYEELKSTFELVKFNLRKWCSNSRELLAMIPDSEQELQALSTSVKALGIGWNPSNDVFSFQWSIPLDSIPTTKRKLTSEIASMFDPLGWAVPVVIRAKHLLQLLWKLNLDWDDNIPEEFTTQWLQIKSQLPLIYDLRVPRWINYSLGDEVELHAFSDASEVGFACCVYVETIHENGEISVNLLCAKARVAPLKVEKKPEATIPRLELSGAMLLAQITGHVIETVPLEFSKICCYTDSKIVLAWINGDPKRWKTFVASRVTKINKLLNKNNWLHVVSEKNPADCASRGLLPEDLVNHSLWWHGPEFLKTNIEEKPQRVSLFDIPNEIVTAFTTQIEHKSGGASSTQSSPNDISFENFDSFIDLQNWVATRDKPLTQNDANESLSTDELAHATRKIIQIVQGKSFDKEISILKKNASLPRSNKFVSLSPFLDENGTLRVGGRLKNSDLPFDTKHQILLPNTHWVTKLLVKECHEKCLHGGPKLTESVLRQNYWITNSQRTIKSIIHKCINCFKANPKPMSQFMANLPSSRVTVMKKPFSKTAVDYTGAIHIKMTNGRGIRSQKAYIAIFVCMATKAIHIEAVTDLTATAFIAAFRRFVARRGAIHELYSDNGTNFVKSNKILEENIDDIDENEYNTAICNELSKCQTRWFFSPPGAPHFNGLAETAVKSVKLHLKKTIGETKLSFEELSTLLAQIEACVNSRPLCSLSSIPNDAGALTPAHFLIGESLVCPPEQNHLETKVNWLSRWQRVQQMTQHFWKRWQSEYLNQLQVRTKWVDRKQSPKINDLVLIREENLPPSQWQMGTIVELHPGDDNLTRVVSIKTGNSITKRPVTKVCAFPKDESVSTIRSNIGKVHGKPKRSNVLPIITAILALCVTLSHQAPVNVEKPFAITKFQKPPGFYFDLRANAYVLSSEWNLIAFID